MRIIIAFVECLIYQKLHYFLNFLQQPYELGTSIMSFFKGVLRCNLQNLSLLMCSSMSSDKNTKSCNHIYFNSFIFPRVSLYFLESMLSSHPQLMITTDLYCVFVFFHITIQMELYYVQPFTSGFFHFT